MLSNDEAKGVEIIMKILSDREGFEQFSQIVGLTNCERDERWARLMQSYMPFKTTEYYAHLIARLEEPDRTQVMNIILPPAGVKPFIGRFDPYGNSSYRKKDTSFLQHKYEKTLLFHVDNFCLSNCQFCYKVNEIRHEKQKTASLDNKLKIGSAYLKSHPEIDNVLVTGGDPAYLPTKTLIKIFQSFLDGENVRIVRFATKCLAFEPLRFLDEELLDFFKKANAVPGKQICMITQINHPAEFGGACIQAIGELRKAGVQLRGQPAIVKGVNDSVNVLTRLQRSFMDYAIVAYYLTLFMPVRGVEQYAVTLDEAFCNIAASKRKLGGLEKKGLVLVSHNYGKVEICGFYPSMEQPEKIILKWHQIVASVYLPDKLKQLIPTNPEDLLFLNYIKGGMYCLDDVFKHNNLPYYDSNGDLMLGNKQNEI